MKKLFAILEKIHGYHNWCWPASLILWDRLQSMENDILEIKNCVWEQLEEDHYDRRR